MALPKTAGDALIERVNHLLENNERNEFILRSVKKEAEALTKSDAFQAYLVLGMIACLERNLETVRDFHSRALKIHDNFIANINYATSLSNLGAYSEAISYYEKAVRQQPENIKALDDFIDAEFNALHFLSAKKLLEKWKKLIPEKKHRHEILIDKVLTTFNKKAISDEEAGNLHGIATDIIYRNKATHAGNTILVLEEDNAEWVDYEILVKKDVAAVVEMNCSLADRAAEKISPKVLSSIVIRYSAAE
jgi:tetratricopeptide (TPR) repeat protein